MENKETKLLDYLAGELPEKERQAVESDLARDANLRREYEELRQMQQWISQMPLEDPGAELRQQFNKTLESEQSAGNTGGQLARRRIKPWQWSVAAAILLAIGLTIGFQLGMHNQNEERIASLEAEFEATRRKMEQLMQDRSTSGRIRAVNLTYKLERVDDEIMSNLIQLLLKDESDNVRLAALEALRYYPDNPKVKQALVEALRTETKPVVQIELIHTLTALKEKEALPVFEELIENEQTFDKVKDEARLGRFKMM